MIDVTMTPEQYEAKVQQLKAEQDFELVGTQGNISHDGFSVGYHYDGQVLAVNVTGRSLIARTLAERKIHNWLTQAPAGMPAKVSTTLAACIALLLGSALLLTTTGCTAQTDAVELLATAQTAFDSIAAIEGTTTGVTQVNTDLAAAEAAISALKAGSDASVAVQLVQVAAKDASLIPLPATDDDLITLFLDGLSAVIVSLDPSAAPTTAAAPAASASALSVRAVVSPSAAPAFSVRAGFNLKSAPKNAKAFKQRWNAATRKLRAVMSCSPSASRRPQRPRRRRSSWT